MSFQEEPKAIPKPTQMQKQGCYFCSKGQHEKCINLNTRTQECCCGGNPSRQTVSAETEDKDRKIGVQTPDELDDALAHAIVGSRRQRLDELLEKYRD